MAWLERKIAEAKKQMESMNNPIAREYYKGRYEAFTEVAKKLQIEIRKE